MNWQELTVFAIVLAAAIYAGRIFLQQFGFGKKPEQGQCAQCGPDKKSGHHSTHILTRKSP